jgi:pimeloyl-ACP methyl ester carboxylesterase
MTLSPPTEQYILTNRITLHCLDYRGNGPTVVLMHGLTANAHAFDGVLEAGILEGARIICPDLRGRGLSSMPAFGYSMQDHAMDIIGMLDAMGIKKVILGGHSFGGLLSIYIASLYPERVEKVILLDAGERLNTRAFEMLTPALSRLDKRFDSFEDYIEKLKAAPYLEFWDEAMRSYYRADVKDMEDGSVTPRSTGAHVMEMSLGVFHIAWAPMFRRVKVPTLLLYASSDYNLGERILPESYALESISDLKQGVGKEVPGNHQTMLYGKGAKAIAQAILEFIA